jgi:hypothetical protein
MTHAEPLQRHGTKPARWHRRSERRRAARPACAPSPPTNIEEASPLDIINWLMKRYCAVIEQEDGKGAAADQKRIDATLKAAAVLTRGLMPFFHRRLKPSDEAPGEYSHEDALAVLDDNEDDERYAAKVRQWDAEEAARAARRMRSRMTANPSRARPDLSSLSRVPGRPAPSAAAPRRRPRAAR